MAAFFDARRTDSDRLEKTFHKYASEERNGEKLMTAEDFIVTFLGLLSPDDYSSTDVRLLAAIADTDKDGYISFGEFEAFEELLCLPDAVYRIAFQLFDSEGNGAITYREFVRVMGETELRRRVPFEVSPFFAEVYFGRDKERAMSYGEFGQFLHDLSEEYAVQSFRRADADGSGAISFLNFHLIMVNVKSHLLTKRVESCLIQVAERLQSDGKVSFPHFTALNSLLKNMELAKRIYLDVTNGKRASEVTQAEFMRSAQAVSRMTPLEVKILFELCEALYQKSTILYDDFGDLTPDCYHKEVSDGRVFTQILENFCRFSLGCVAGSVGAAAVFPIDLVKTRMQNQRVDPKTGERMYKHSVDCFVKILAREGVRGLYRGLPPVIVGVAPEKAIQLSVKDFVREKFRSHGTVPLYGEILAGGAAGVCQVFVTNPLEVVKIRMQTAGEAAGGGQPRAWRLVRELGLVGLYRGARACWLRDITFAAIYFSTYARAKAKTADEDGRNHPATLLFAGFVAGIPAAGLVTPADVIKTRLQVAARDGQATYGGIFDAARKILLQEGFRAFWKGAALRMCRTPPQFAATMLTYETLQRLFDINLETPRAGGHNPDHVGGYSDALQIFSRLEARFGLCLPKLNASKN